MRSRLYRCAFTPSPYLEISCYYQRVNYTSSRVFLCNQGALSASAVRIPNSRESVSSRAGASSARVREDGNGHARTAKQAYERLNNQITFVSPAHGRGIERNTHGAPPSAPPPVVARDVTTRSRSPGVCCNTVNGG